MGKFLAIAAAALFALPAVAQAPAERKPEPKAAPKPETSIAVDSPRALKLLKGVEEYINAMKSISGSFVQRSSNGANDSGTFYISKPGRMRLEYKSPILLVADGASIVYQDKKLDQISYMSLDSNPASIILKGDVRLTGAKPSAVVRGISESGGTAEIALALPNAKDAGSLTLLFSARPLSLEGWRVRDPQGITTDVSLLEIRESASFDSSLFKITRNRTIGGSKNSGKYY
ncbi:MAG: outer membrane lipoprotein carrier protein LolA [Rickettsiales bacterium]|jgi:outer membrane lipoprotein-sorting protein|nr:outer membrane lipoprotein carrier protein LolA [Rickettsiales bacterium]